MRLIFAGTPAVALPSLDAHRRLPSRAGGRGHPPRRASRPGPPAGAFPGGAWADERGIEVLTPARPGEPEFLDRLRALAPDCVPVVAYGALVPPAALAIPATAG